MFLMAAALSLIGPNGFLVPAARLQVERGSLHLHTLGPRTLSAFLEELGRAHGVLPDILDQLERYERLELAQILVARADRFPCRLWPVPR